MRGFVGGNGRFYSDAQRKAIFANFSRSNSCVPVAVSTDDNRFAVGASLGAAMVASKVGSSLAPTVVSVPKVAPVVSAVVPSVAVKPKSLGFGSDVSYGIRKGFADESSALIRKEIHGVIGRAEGTLLSPVVKPAAFGVHAAEEITGTAVSASQPGMAALGATFGSGVSALSDLGEPRAMSVGEMLADGHKTGVDSWGVPSLSRVPAKDCGTAWSINTDRVRDVVRKQYPCADVDAEVVLLPSDEYMSVALEMNPGREDEAMMSNGFYSPASDTAYLEAGDRLNTLRALIHEYVHDMKDDGVEDYMLNEGYADYVAKNIMTQEIGIPERVVNATLGYPREVKRVESLVDKYGREHVDRAFLKYGTLDYLESLDKNDSKTSL